MQQADILTQIANQRLLTFPKPPLSLQNMTVTLTPCGMACLTSFVKAAGEGSAHPPADQLIAAGQASSGICEGMAAVQGVLFAAYLAVLFLGALGAAGGGRLIILAQIVRGWQHRGFSRPASRSGHTPSQQRLGPRARQPANKRRVSNMRP